MKGITVSLTVILGLAVIVLGILLLVGVGNTALLIGIGFVLTGLALAVGDRVLG